MEKVLRALRFLSLALWLSLTGFVLLNIYFAATGQFWIYISRPFSVEYKNTAKLIAYVRITNKGFFDIMNFVLKGSLTDGRGQPLCENSTKIKRIGPGADLFIEFVLYLPSDTLKTEGAFDMIITANMIYAYIFPMRVKVSFEVEAPSSLISSSSMADLGVIHHVFC